MTTRGKHSLARFLAFATALVLSMASAACGNGQQDAGTTSIDTDKVSVSSAAAKSNVIIFTPSDGISISSHTPLNKWAKFAPAITKSLTNAGFQSKNIKVKADGTLTKQSDDVQDYVVNQLSTASDDTNRHTTLIVAPATSGNKGNEQYGDYVTNPADAATYDTEKPASTGNSTDANGNADSPSSSSSSSSSDKSTQTQDGNDKDKANANDEATAAKRLAKTLKLAKKAGAHTIILANPLAGFTPDIFVSMSTPRQIGALQAQQLVSKLALEKTTKMHPKAVEVMIPVGEDDDSTTDTSEAFAKEAFAGIWDVLQPYFKDGRAISPSKRLTATTTDNDWESVAFKASKTAEVKSELDARLNGSSKDSKPLHVDGILGMNDFVSSAVVDELTSLKYTGTAADINPEIEVSGIVGTLTGKHNLNKQAPPKPKDNKQDTTEGEEQTQTDGEGDLSWPILTGYGAYTDMMPDVVNGKQWMTGMEDIQKLSHDIAGATATIEAGKNVTDLSYVKAATINSSKMNTIHEKPMAISASNLKHLLIEPGYISLADAGL
ncbi:hypothetical protein OZX72_05010 [Bifidobacterium sp. ESL0769]|uniref:hypothetical protein n=1 Tax=Bifidobacterium sp. ESL0769 TaxID=2983229 RepID=UPI0023F93F55|nr:hypothetical protein [Bifidobacterium sp. ESL0769]WEV68330.1 hypothetical protein OZX72_05010 [Bifidobacterium sp. ESL0769]